MERTHWYCMILHVFPNISQYVSAVTLVHPQAHGGRIRCFGVGCVPGKTPRARHRTLRSIDRPHCALVHGRDTPLSFAVENPGVRLNPQCGQSLRHFSFAICSDDGLRPGHSCNVVRSQSLGFFVGYHF